MNLGQDYGDGGAFPEVHVAQYPLDMGRKERSTSNALAIQLDAQGKIKYDILARQGHGKDKVSNMSINNACCGIMFYVFLRIFLELH